MTAKETGVREGSSALSAFYARALSEAERELLERSAEVEGLDDEIALLRVKLMLALAERPNDLELLMKGVHLLVQAVAARYRLSPQSKKDLLGNLLGVLKGIHDQLYVEASDDGDLA